MTDYADPDVAAGDDHRPGHRGARERRRLPGAVWLVTAVHLLLLVVWSLVVPVLRAPDEPQHLDMLLVLEEGEPWPGLRERAVDGRVLSAMDAAGLDYLNRRVEPADVAAGATPRASRPPLAALPPEASRLWWNQQWQHPPLSYLVTAAGTHLLSGTADPVDDLAFDRYIWIARLVSIALVAPLPLLVAMTLQRLGAGTPIVVAGSVLPLAVPQLTHIGSTINNDNLLTAAVAVVTWLLVRVVTGDRSLRTALGVGVATGVAVLAKGFGLFLALWVPLAYVWLAVRARSWRPLWLGVAAGVTAFAVGGWWYVRNLVVHGVLQPRGMPLQDVAPPGFTPDPAWWAQFAAAYVPQRFWGSFGWYQVSLTWPVVWIATGVVVVGVALALLRPVGARFRPVSLFLLVPLVSVGGIVGYGAWNYYLAYGAPIALQGRYLFHAVPALAVVTALGYGSQGGLLRRRLVPLAVVAAALMQGNALVAVTDRYWGAADGSGSLDALLAWAPTRPVFTMSAIVACAVGAVVLLAVAGRSGRDHVAATVDDDDPPTGRQPGRHTAPRTRLRRRVLGRPQPSDDLAAGPA